MEFEQRHYLWLLLLVPLLVTLRHRVWESALPWPSVQGLEELPRHGMWKTWVSDSLVLLAVVATIVAVARPRWPDPTGRVPVQATAIVMLLDISGSMAERDFILDGEPVSRLEAAKHAFKHFLIGNETLTGRYDDLVGLVTFAARVESVHPPTLRHTALLQVLDRAEPVSTPPDSTTNLGDAMVQGLQLLQRSAPEHKRLVVLSDGEQTVPPQVVADACKPEQAAHLAKGLGIRVDTIRVGPRPEDERDEFAIRSARIGTETMKTLADLTSGESFVADDTPALERIYRSLDGALRSRVEAARYTRYWEAYPWLGLVAFLALCLAIFWDSWSRRLP